MKKLIAFFLLGVSPLMAQNDLTPPPPPDYSKAIYWAALPFQPDAADEVPKGLQPVADEEKAVDVFYVYPTVLKSGKQWNADVNDTDLNQRIEKQPIRYQASVFNASCRVYAPRYRQAHFNAYFTKDRESADKAFELAYSDVLTAFKYYLEHYNQGRPFILASHSQGTTHSRRLAKEMIDGKPLAKQLVAAYLIGMPIKEDLYESLQPCETPEQIGCFVSWMSYKEGYEPKATEILQGGVMINPITWRREDTQSDKKTHEGMILRNFDKKRQQTVSAQVHEGILWVNANNLLTKIFNNYHIVDYNLFWYDIRKHVAEQVALFLKK